MPIYSSEEKGDLPLKSLWRRNEIDTIIKIYTMGWERASRKTGFFFCTHILVNVQNVDKKIMNIEAIDGFLLGDGCISLDKRMTRLAGRLSCSQEYEEFAQYQMAFFEKSTVKKYNTDRMKQGYAYFGRTEYDENLYEQRIRWYKDGEKQPPDDVQITPLSVMIWYLGDGCVCKYQKTIKIRLSTDSFKKERVEFLASKLTELGILAHRDGDNRIMIEARGIPKFFDFIGRESPVSCYSYKFELPEWRFAGKRMRDVANELAIDYNRLSYLVKIGKIPCYRQSSKGKPMFLPEHMEAVQLAFKDRGSKIMMPT